MLFRSDKCDSEHGCKDADGGCVACYASCQDYGSSHYDGPVEGKTCLGPDGIMELRIDGGGRGIIMKGEGHAAPAIGPLKCYLCY